MYLERYIKIFLRRISIKIIMREAVITGIPGLDDSYLAELSGLWTNIGKN